MHDIVAEQVETVYDDNDDDVSDDDSEELVDESEMTQDFMQAVSGSQFVLNDDSLANETLGTNSLSNLSNSSQDTKKKELTSEENKKILMQKRVEQIKLFYETEKAYFELLQCIDQLFINSSKFKSIVSSGKRSEIFGDLDCIRMINKDLFSELDKSYKACENEEEEINKIEIGRMILKRAPTLRLYNTFVNNLEKVLRLVGEIELTNDYQQYYKNEVQSVLQEKITKYRSECSKLSIEKYNEQHSKSRNNCRLSNLFSSIPFERIRFYAEWLQEMAYKKTESNNSDYENLHESHRQIQEIDNYCEEKCRELEKMKRFTKLTSGNFLSQNKKYYNMNNLGFPEPENPPELKKYQSWKKSYDKHVKKVKKAWSKKNLNLSASNSSVKNLIKKYGISSSFRPKVWMEISGAQAKLNQHSGYYKKMLMLHASKADDTYVEQIEKDLRRTFIYHPYFNDINVVAAMRRILLAYSCRNPLVNYCQSFNFIVGIMLLHLGEEEVFWLFVTMVEDYLPLTYYSPELKGVLVDAMVVDELFSFQLSKLANHLKSFDFDISTFTISFFMKQLTVDFPIETTLRYWDCLFCFGSQIMFKTVLAILKLNQDALLKTSDMSECLILIQDIVKTSFDCNKIMKTAFGFSKITQDKIKTLRNKYIKPIERELKNQKRSKR
jgi:hypothetical protein